MSTTLSLPPSAALDQALTELTASAGDVSTVKALRKARYHLADGLRILPTATGFLIPSGTRANVVHEVSFMGECSCEASGVCWHQQAIGLIERAQRYAIPLANKIAAHRAQTYAEAVREMDELFA